MVRNQAPVIVVHYETSFHLVQKNGVGSVVTQTLELDLTNVGFTS